MGEPELREQQCVERYSYCVCTLPDLHGEQPHLCDCGGSWITTPDGVRPVTLPGGEPADLAGSFETLYRVLGELAGDES